MNIKSKSLVYPIAGLSLGLLATLFGMRMSSAIEVTPTLNGNGMHSMGCHFSEYCWWDQR
ncbi:MAG: hypothetical protein ACI96W_002819 [Paraglaciecola sp.]|jgi:hypothetical protein